MPIFNVSRYQLLLTKTGSSTSNNKNLFDEPIFLELLSFESSVETQVFYNHRNNYFALIQKYLSEIINPNVFRGQFIEMVNKDLKNSQKLLQNFEELSTFWIDLELDNFSSLFENIHETCLYAFEFEDQEGAMPEDKFRASLEKIFLQMEKFR